MREIRFIKENVEKWEKVENSMKEKSHLSADELGDLYIDLIDDLSYSKTFYPKSRTNDYLNGLTTRVHNQIYKNKKERGRRLKRFFKYEVPLACWENRKNMLLSLIVFSISFVIGSFSQYSDNDFVRKILGDAYVDQTIENIENDNPMGVYQSDYESFMFVGIAQNNIKVAFIAFVGGITANVYTLFLLFFNGIMLGSFQTFFIQQSLGWQSFSTVFIHGALEISAIILAGGAGLSIGNALLFPGTYTRRAALLKAGKSALKVIVGLVPIFLVAAFLESFVTRHYQQMDDIIRAAVVFISFAYIVWYFFVYPSHLVKTGIATQVEREEEA